MKLDRLVLITLCALLVLGSVAVSKSLLKIEESEEGSGEPLTDDIEKVDRKTPDDTESTLCLGSGVDDDDTEESGSGSGDGSGCVDVNITATVLPTKKDTTRLKTTQTVVVVVDINTVSQSTTAATTAADKVPKSTKKGDGDLTSLVTTMGNSVVENEPPIASVRSITESPNAIPSQSFGPSPASDSVNFTVAIIVGVVVGAILSILIIVFLVYRLRKKDEGSYSLDEPSSAMLRADTDSPPPKGKEEYLYETC